MSHLDTDIAKSSADPFSGCLIVTTGTTAGTRATERCRSIAEQFHAPCIPRRNGGGGLAGMLQDAGADRAIIVEEYGLALAHKDGTVFRWHPNLGFVRALNIARGQADTFARAARLIPGSRVLDCTLGFGSEALLASLLVGESGGVVGLESVPELALLTAAGMSERALSHQSLMDAVRRITVINADYISYLQSVKPGRFDVICFDPFFAERVEGSGININPLFRFGNTLPLNVDSVFRAIAVASQRVVVKHPRSEELPEPLTALQPMVVQAKRSPIRYSVFENKESSY